LQYAIAIPLLLKFAILLLFSAVCSGIAQVWKLSKGEFGIGTLFKIKPFNCFLFTFRSAKDSKKPL
jgi:hypothetical protein